MARTVMTLALCLSAAAMSGCSARVDGVDPVDPEEPEVLFPELDVRPADIVTLEGPGFTSFAIEEVFVTRAGAYASTRAHWWQFDEGGTWKARGVGELFDADDARLLLRRGGGAELVDTDGEVLATVTLEIGALVAGGLAHDDSGDFWVASDESLVVFDDSGATIAEIDFYDGGRIELRDGKLVTGDAWIELATGTDLLEEAVGEPLSVLPSGNGFVTALAGIVRLYDDAGNETEVFDAPWSACAPLSAELLACEAASGLSVYREGSWQSPIERIDDVEVTFTKGSALVTSEGAAEVVTANGDQVVRSGSAPRVLSSGPIAWLPDGSLFVQTHARFGLAMEAEGPARTLLEPAFEDAVSSRYVALLAPQEVHLFDRASGAAIDSIAIADEIDWDVLYPWLGEDYPGDGTESARHQLSFSADGAYLAVMAARPDTQGEVDGHYGRHYTIWVFETEPLSLVATFEQFDGDGGHFDGNLLKAEDAWRAPPSFEEVSLESGEPSGQATYVAALSSAQVAVRDAQTGELVRAYPDRTGFAWAGDDRIALWTDESAVVATVADGSELEVELPGEAMAHAWIPDRASEGAPVCGPLREVEDSLGERHALRPRIDAETGDVSFLIAEEQLSDPRAWDDTRGSNERESCHHGVFYLRSDWEIATTP